MSKLGDDPLVAFEQWFNGLDGARRIDIAVRLVYAVPELGIDIDSDVETRVLEFLRRPYGKSIELIGRIGLLKTLIDVEMMVIVSRNDVEAFGKAAMTLRRAQSQAKGDPSGAELARLAYDSPARNRNADADMYLSWGELTEEGAWSAVSLYDWQFRELGRTSPISPQDG